MSFLRNAWYMAAWDREIDKNPVPKRILGEPIVMYRTGSGVAVALHDRCPHKAVPLHAGRIEGDLIQCAYHGLRFDSRGVCRHNPHIKGSPDTLCVRAYPLAKRHGALWIWMGEPERANVNAIPDYGWFDVDGPYAVTQGYTYVDGGFGIMMDNLLDLSHAEYLHPNTVGTPGSSGSLQTSVVAGDDYVTVKRKVFDLPPSVVFRPHWSRSERIDQVSDMTWRPGTNLLLDIRLRAAGDDSGNGELHFPSAHILTPETERTTHYFWAVARNFKQEDEGLTLAINEAFQQTFTGEDKPIIEAIQRQFDIEGNDVPVANFTIGDGGGVRAKRMLAKLIADEQLVRS
ncbi:aromatic ring-hydroxylating dioxygenase subunit alpha [Pandoraea bronchicola]|uniref:Toluene-4-sulfonate monooxygenase system iron-sulfur subunit TsaM1 n=1 Tax=Pandoraea bronchicola TaxID=2508287 RepID=A0A5E5C1P0_9BURK|nr:aromatic ring-hydroxylating dioxygenase subunit alpha [Pandoraea bronchicola]VVE90550.1 Toluene-4-sulfonate monooxygenase system iron-sulfur subunit TsaM1 [Pandoraea bronchicola]